MISILLVCENREGQEMLKTMRRLLGRVKGIGSVMLRPGQSVARMQSSMSRVINKFNHEQGLLLLTDFYGSTQWNVCMKFIKKGSIEILTGFNLPMLVKLGTLQEKMPFKELIPFIEQYGREQIRHCNRKIK